MNTTNVSKYAGNVILVYFKDSVKGGCMTIKIQHPSDPTGWDLGRGRSSRKLSTGSPLPREAAAIPALHPYSPSTACGAGEGPHPSMLPAASLSKGQLCCNKKGGLSPSSVHPANLPLLRPIPSSDTSQRQEEEAPGGSCCVGGAGEASGSARPPITG